MEHNPFLSLDGETEITYSDLKTKENGDEYITIYFETAYENGFKSMDYEYPGGSPEHVIGYTQTEMDALMKLCERCADIAFESAKEDRECFGECCESLRKIGELLLEQEER